jgi:hypothetical protein
MPRGGADRDHRRDFRGEGHAAGGLGRFEAKANKKGERLIWLEPH